MKLYNRVTIQIKKYINLVCIYTSTMVAMFLISIWDLAFRGLAASCGYYNYC